MDPDWWIGTDLEGRQWLVKMKGSFYAYREHVFASLAQRAGIRENDEIRSPKSELRGE